MIGNGALGNLDACEGRKRLSLHQDDGCGDHDQYPTMIVISASSPNVDNARQRVRL
jgi:hypothetical protein